jgi:hypothetical protein
LARTAAVRPADQRTDLRPPPRRRRRADRPASRRSQSGSHGWLSRGSGGPRSRGCGAFRGVDTLTARSLHLELSADWQRFEKAHRVGSWLGRTPSLHQSGESSQPGSITKTGAPGDHSGRAHARRSDSSATSWRTSSAGYGGHPTASPRRRPSRPRIRRSTNSRRGGLRTTRPGGGQRPARTTPGS